ncbi:unnamed protein product [Rhizophagus irregularis]|nr:unnamed protein product [Rhizophagus irregularis]
MFQQEKYTNIIDLNKVTKCKINGKSFLEAFSTALRKVPLMQPTDINGTIMHLMLIEEYNSTEQFVKDHKHVLKELGMKNDYILNDIIAEHETSIDETFQEQMAQFKLTELSNDMPVSTLVQPMEMKIFENIEHQSIDVEYDDQNTEHQSEDVIAESSTKNSEKSFTKLNAKAIPYTQKEKDVLSKNYEIKRKVSDSKALPAKKKQQRAPPKEIQSVMTGYDPVLKDNVQKITLYDISSTWTSMSGKEREQFQAVVKDIPGTITTSMLYPSDSSQSPISHLGCKAFKVVQEKSTCKLITYYKNWADLNKITNTKMNLQEYEGVWTRYFSSQLSKGHNRSPRSGRNQKQNQNSANKVGPTTTDNKNKEGKPSGKKNNSYTLKNLKKGLDGSELGKLMLLAKIRSLLRRLEN